MSINHKKSHINRLFFQYFQTFTIVELTQFQKHCQSPTVHLTQQAQEILEISAICHPDFVQLDYRLNRYLAQAPTLSPRSLNHSFHDLSELLQKWLIQQEVTQDELLQQQLLIRVNKKRFQHKYFFKNTEKALQFLHDDQLEIPDTWLHRQQVNAQIFYHTLSQKFTPNPSQLRDMENNLDLYYYGLKIRLAAQNLLRSRFIQEQTPNANLPILLEFAQQHQNLIFFYLYGNLIQYLQNPVAAHFQKLVETFKNQHQKLDRIEQAIFINLLINSISPQPNQDNLLHQKYKFHLYQLALDYDLVLLDNEMSPSFLNNIFMLACLSKKFSLAKRILKKHSTYLPLEVKDDLTSLLTSTLLFHQKKYTEIETHLNLFHFQHPLFKISGRVLLLKSFYERLNKAPNFKNTCLAELVSFKKFIVRQKTLSVAKKESYLNLVVTLRQLIKIKFLPFSKQAEAKNILQSFLFHAEKSIGSKSWLFEKFKEL